MTVDELERLAQGDGKVPLLLDRPIGNSLRVRLTTRGGPLGYPVTETRDGKTIALFERAAIRRWLAKKLRKGGAK